MTTEAGNRGASSPRSGLRHEPHLDDNRLLLFLALGLVLPVVGWVAGATDSDRFSSYDDYAGAFVAGAAARVFAVPFAVSIVINAFLWARRSRGTSSTTRRIRIAIAAVDVAGLAWLGSLFLPGSVQPLWGFVAGTCVAVFSVVLWALLLRIRRARRLALPPALRAAEDAKRGARRKRDLRVAAAVVSVAVATGIVISTIPTGRYSRCEVTGETWDGAGHIGVSTLNCGDLALRGNYAAYTALDFDTPYAITTRGYSLFPWEPKIATMTPVG